VKLRIWIRLNKGEYIWLRDGIRLNKGKIVVINMSVGWDKVE
jgi:hypothetical protein